jgi:hypothetical protein
VPSAATLSLYPLNGLRDQARIVGTTVVDELADGSTAFFVRSRLMRLSVDRLTITPIAGTQQDGYADGPGATAQFSQPFGLTHDATGVIYVADRNNNVIRRVALDGTVSDDRRHRRPGRQRRRQRQRGALSATRAGSCSRRTATSTSPTTATTRSAASRPRASSRPTPAARRALPTALP